MGHLSISLFIYYWFDLGFLYFMTGEVENLFPHFLPMSSPFVQTIKNPYLLLATKAVWLVCSWIQALGTTVSYGSDICAQGVQSLMPHPL